MTIPKYSYLHYIATHPYAHIKMKDYLLFTIGYLFRVLLMFLSICVGYMLPALFVAITSFDYTQYFVTYNHPGYPYVGGLFAILLFVLWVKSIEFVNHN